MCLRCCLCFCVHSPFPSKKAITLLKSEPFSVSLSYDPADGHIPPHFNKQLGTYTVELPKVRCGVVLEAGGWGTAVLFFYISMRQFAWRRYWGTAQTERYHRRREEVLNAAGCVVLCDKLRDAIG
jgi:hypothetical protein